MKVATSEPFKLIYSILNHEYLGYLLESFVVQLDAKGQLTFLNQNVSAKNIDEFREGLEECRPDELDVKLVHLIDDMQQEAIYKKFSTNKKKNIVDFFLKVYDPQKGDKALQEAIAAHIESVKAEIMPLLLEKQLFIMGSDGNPAWQKVEVLPEKATVLFHFMRNEDNTHYFPTIKYNGTKVDFQYKNAFLICDEPAWMILNNQLYHFAKDVDGKKLRPFLNKRFIVIPKNIEEDYYRKFVTSIITLFDVYAKGFEIRSESHRCIPQLSLVEHRAKVLASESNEPDDDSHVSFHLSFQYGSHNFKFEGFDAKANVSMEKKDNDYVFHKVKRDLLLEKETLDLLQELGLNLQQGSKMLEKHEAFSWLQTSYEALTNGGITIVQEQSEAGDGKRYFLGYSTIEVRISEGNDWFDIHTLVKFVEFEIPFIQLRNLILQKKKEFVLPSGEIAVIPESWFTQYSELFAFIEHNSEQEGFILKKYHLSLVQELEKDSLATATMSRKLKQLQGFEAIQDYPLPAEFVGTLRPYQKAGYNWMRFLNDYHFGGCLADDMGLGKTVQTLALLLSQKEQGNQYPSLLIMPTSLLYNWEMEAKKFAPSLRILVYAGTYRDKNSELFNNYDVILSSYGIVRIDIDLLKNYRFNYVILDESQAIKNPNSSIAKAVMQFNSRRRLVLTGTPLENSTLDLWSQMTFINPGLLGSLHFFRNEFQLPIEKKNDETKIKRLFAIIKPFMLRRHKSQVATELPPKIESVYYTQLSEQQEKIYEEAKCYYRNLILKQIDNEGMAKSHLMVLQGLSKLRMLANHPRMNDETYEGDSGKFNDVIDKLGTVLEEGHKVLIFSQFVKHLSIFRDYLDNAHIRYTYLDGSTQDRQTQVATFQENEDIKIFLISLKAGGVGLNLTAADYVFILDPWWNPAIEAQAIDRAHRIGQERNVFTYKFIAKNTVEEKILALQRSKQRLASELITTEEHFVKSLSQEDILNLLE